ncbi:MAG: FAD:protein FMN transferase [Deltaproteobacteria bacterium]|nr:FAD:protein FMN transferase [Deltaproteobacteria bacterium]
MAGLILIAMHAATGRAEEVRESHYVMGTLLQVTLDAPTRERGQDIIADAIAVARQLEREFSDYDDSSDLTRVNHRAGEGAVPVPLDLFRILSLCQLLTRSSGGTFDITVGPLVHLRRNAAATGRTPGDAEVDAAFALVGSDKISLQAPGRVELPRRGMELDLGAIGKGYALERMAALLRAAGVVKALLDFGTSSMLAIGPPQGETPWRIWVPRGHDMAGSIFLRDRAVSTSRSLHRDDGRAQTSPHIVDPRSGRWIEVDRQATVVAIDASIAEAWSTALIVDPDGGLDILAAPRDVEAIVYDEHGERRTPRFEEFASWKPARRGGRGLDDKVEGSGGSAPSNGGDKRQ